MRSGEDHKIAHETCEGGWGRRRMAAGGGASHVTYHTIARYSTNKRYIVKISLQLQLTVTTVTNIFYIHLEAACGFMTFQ